jgi:hypothetical protein
LGCSGWGQAPEFLYDQVARIPPKDIHLKIGKLHKDEIHGKILDNAGFVSYFHFDEGVGRAIP